MKKVLLLAFALVLALGADAQTVYKKSWDFRKWSAGTVADLKAGSDWSDIEKATGTAPTELSKDNCFWEVTAAGKTDEDVTLTANGNVIKELEGLYYTNTTSRSLAIAVNYQTNMTGDGYEPYEGPSYLWLGSSKKNYFIIPHVEPGTKIEIGVESHKTSDNRGIELYIGHGSNGTKLKDPDGIDVPTVSTYQVQTWLVPVDATDTPNEDGTFDIQIRNTNGCHLYYIKVGDGDTPPVEEAKKVAYVSNVEDYAYTFLSGSDGVELTMVSPAEAITLDSLQTYDAIIIAPSVAPTDALVPVLKSAVAYAPVINMNSSLYETWGYGAPVTTTEVIATVAAEDAENALFKDLDVAAGLELLTDGTLAGVSLGSYFANDKVLAKAGDAVAIHQHNPDRNSYIYLPFSSENLETANFEILPTFLGNAVSVVAASKAKVTAVTTPAISQENKNQETVVTITEGNKAATVYYTIDGTEPTTASTVYTEPFTLTSAATVKAMAVADGYLQSATASLDVVIMSQAAKPAIAIEKNADNSVVTFSCATEGATIYYSYNMEKDAAKAQKYTEPIVLKEEPTFIYAFATAEGFVPSELAGDYVAINSITAQTIRIDTLAHFDANEAEWYLNDAEAGGTGAAKAYYFWGKSAWKYYSDEVDHTETVKGSEGQDSTVYYYKPDPNAVKIASPLTPNGWVLKSAGQVLTGELTDTPQNAVGNGNTGYFAETAEDLIGGAPSKGKITFGGKTSGEPYTASIETTEKHAAPFDVITYIANGNSGAAGKIEIQVSADGEKWDSIGTALMSSTQRYYKKTRVSYNEAGEYYVRLIQVGGGSKAQVYDIYILNNGEESKKYDPATVGIESVSAAAVAYDEIFSVNGVRQNSLRKGLNIVRKHLADGTVKTVKVMVK